MNRDVLTMIWKEWREFRDQLLSLRRGGLSALILIGVLGIVTPAQMGPEWVRSPFMVAYWPFVAASMVSSLIADSVAGERERHTLETLLASRLSDGAILAGKLIAAVLYGVGFAIANLLIGLVAVNVVHREAGLSLFSPSYFASILLLTTLTAAFVAGVGVFISLRAATVKQAQQTFGIAMVVLILGPVLAFEALPEMRLRVIGLVSSGPSGIVGTISSVLAGLTLIVLIGARARFRRGKLGLD
jgi:ABC-2 type transport system permease protein